MPISGVLNLIFNSPPEIKKEIVEVVGDTVQFYNAKDLRLSQKGRDMIRDHEKLRLKAYKIGDGMITVGWGHAEPINKSKFKVGQVISIEKANSLFQEDLSTAANGVRRMFSDWSESGNNVPITQDMFDALVSIAYNSGVSGLRNSEISKHLKEKKYESAGELIKTFKISPKFKGLSKRRSIESSMFLSFLNLEEKINI